MVQSLGEPIYRPRDAEVVWRRLDDGAVLLDLRSSTYLSLNPSGTVLWERLQEGATRRDLVAVLGATFTLDPDRATRDVDGFIAECRSRELVTETAPQT